MALLLFIFLLVSPAYGQSSYPTADCLSSPFLQESIDLEGLVEEGIVPFAAVLMALGLGDADKGKTPLDIVPSEAGSELSLKIPLEGKTKPNRAELIRMAFSTLQARGFTIQSMGRCVYKIKVPFMFSQKLEKKPKPAVTLPSCLLAPPASKTIACTLSPQDLQALTPEKMITEIRVVPFSCNGEISAGLKVLSVKDGSLFSQMLRPQDVWFAINDQILSFQQPVDFVEIMKESETVTIQVLRNKKVQSVVCGRK